MQPRVFDLLVHLVRNAGRVVPKDELMDALWPDVIVTEASLQRLVSLARRALEPGGLDGAIRSFVRHGYRFSVDRPVLALTKSEAAEGGLSEALRLMQQREWLAAAQMFEKLDADGNLSAENMDRWALAVECLGRPAAAIPVLIRAVGAHVKEGSPHLAARDAVTLAKIEIDRSAVAASAGWMDRADALKAGIDDPRTNAYFLWMKSRLASFGGRAKEALDLAAAAHQAATACGDQGLIALSLTYHGFYNIALGRTDEGVGQQNHAAAIALSSGVDPIMGSTIYCNILWSCRTYADWSRARQWSQGFDSWCEANYAEASGSCDLHRAEVLGAQRNLIEALEAIEEAMQKLSEEEAFSVGDGYRVRGDIKAMIGDLDAAREDYGAAYAIGWDAEPGNAVLLADEGKFEAALMALDRALAGASWFHLQRRGMLLAYKARIAAQWGNAQIAIEALDELDAEPERWKQSAVHALVNETHYHLDSGKDPMATRRLLLARQLWTSAGIEYHAARVRLTLAEALFRTGDTVGAQAELSAAERTGIRIRSRRLSVAAASLSASLAPAMPAPAAGEGT
ncbi:MAG: winged helix-turn-helix domain-containing protein [Rhodobacteraceae bacterium]|nr:winged helix-turn-helix domain-containing protein [Paracoccaceae bacterium]